MQSFTVDTILDKKHKCLCNRKKCGVYKITNIINNKIYIGSSKSILQRWKNHIRELELNIHGNMFLQSDWKQYGKENFIFEVLEECDEDERYIVEQKYLDELLPFYRSNNGYNISEKSTQRNETNVRLFKPENPVDDYFMVKAKGCRPYIMDGEHCRTTSREKLEDECYALQTYEQLRSYILYSNGYDDDWD